MKIQSKIHIEKPCDAHRSNFVNSSCGQYCSICKEEVVDYTKKSKRELAELIKNNQLAKCGSFFPEQLEETYIHPLIRIPKVVWVYLSSLFLMHFSTKAVGNDHKVKNEVVVSTEVSKPAGTYKSETKIKGRVFHSEKNKPLKNVLVGVLNDTNAVYTDDNGVFELGVSAEMIDSNFTFRIYRKDLSLNGGYGGLWQKQYIKVNPETTNLEQMLFFMSKKQKPRRRLFRRKPVKGRIRTVRCPSF
ncbi:MAG: carboxypeptidase-like regulatory domain-containing protein [Flavobacteriales bacterium]|nr:carboxypeptidase-like regulatory domain-containing protein [Flavobacteriales bacterium]